MDQGQFPYRIEIPPWEKRRSRKIPFVNIVLFIATFCTTTISGAIQQIDPLDLYQFPFLLYKGLSFSLTLLLILGIHELGHYYTSKRWGVKATLPFFIPAPPLIGTFGAFIKMQSPIYSRKALFDIGVAGPLAGFVVALPALVIGLRLSEVKPMLTPLGASLGESLLLKYLVPQILEIPSESYAVILHPIAFAAWFGLFVTALNLLPIGQLDGGHIVYALLPQAHKYIALLTIGTLFSIAIMTRWFGWVIWIAITLSLGFRHPPVVEEISSLGLKRRVIGLFALMIFAITFTPVPFPF